MAPRKKTSSMIWYKVMCFPIFNLKQMRNGLSLVVFQATSMARLYIAR
ncbi:unnamed protein product [Arabidopsis thaliana]|uniref:(thale cress) hypothetical protein n=1 Tax=Arabidopsis thaliana TaxID=3702 RepID=A0A7G2ECY8_ARATH|nr:unnamed protein product [Arabidopsis thaliana]